MIIPFAYRVKEVDWVFGIVIDDEGLCIGFWKWHFGFHVRRAGKNLNATSALNPSESKAPDQAILNHCPDCALAKELIMGLIAGGLPADWDLEKYFEPVVGRWK